MTTTLIPTPTDRPAGTGRTRRRIVLVAALVVAAGAGAGAGLAVSSSGSPGSTQTSGYAYYRQVMGGYGPMMGPSGYGWMMGGASAPGWMAGGSLPGSMMGTGRDMGQVMGSLFAGAPGPRVSASEAAALGNQAPTGATVDRAANRITFTGTEVSFAVLAGPPGGPDETFRIAGLVDPAVVVPAGASVTAQLINADPDSAHGLVVTAGGASSVRMPMMASAVAFPGAAVWFLGDPTSAGMHTATLTFTASTASSYSYLCPVPGHAQKGMAGVLTVEG